MLKNKIKNTKQDRYAVIGNPVQHSKSPDIHLEFAKQTGHAIAYERIEAPLHDFVKTIQDFQAAGGKGASITVPFKTQAYELADQQDQLAKEAHAASAIKLCDDGAIFAMNTDGTGLIQDLTHNLDYSLRQKRILIIGAGGATRGILSPFLNQAPAKIIVANRTKTKAEALAKQYESNGHIIGIGLDEIEPVPYDLIINATSAGYLGETLILPSNIIGEHTLCYDLSYSDKPTAFLQWSLDHGATRYADGLGMLVEGQAGIFYQWRGVYPDTQAIIKRLNDARS